jgi:hypothetical protein
MTDTPNQANINKIETIVQLVQELDEQKRQEILSTAADVQKLLKQVEQSYPTEMLKQPEAVIPYLIRQVEANRTLKYRLADALTTITIEAFLDLIDYPFTNVLGLALKQWERPQKP